MTAWFIRLGEAGKDESLNLKFYRYLAENHSVIKIGYALDRGFALQNQNFAIARSRSDIETSFKSCIQRRNYHPNLNLNPRQINWRATLIHRFISEVKKGEMVISPFGDASGNFQIGIIKSDCRTVEAFVPQNTLISMLQNQHRGIGILQRPTRSKPARKVEWKYRNVPLNSLPFPLDIAMANHKHMQPTTNRLNTGTNGTVNMASLQSFAINGGIQGNFTL